jgi:cell division protein FtsZ
MTSSDNVKLTDLKPRLTVVGVGGAGCNAINNMIAAGLAGVDFVVANTDAQALLASSAEHRIQLGTNLTEGLGAGSRPEIGEAAAEEAMEELRTQVAGSHMVFIAAGMGGGTGTGAAAVIARAAKEQGILTVGVVTKPFQFEGARRMRIAETGIEELRKYVDTLIVIPNQNLFRIANNKTTFAEAFVLADQVLYSGVACIVDLIIKEGLINLDFADVRTVMSGMGTAMMGTGEATGERRAIEAAEEAISNPLLDDVCLQGAKGLLLSITGGGSMTLFEVDEAASRVREEVDPEANIIVGATFDEAMGDRVRVSIVASGMARMIPAQPVTQPGMPHPAHTSQTGGVRIEARDARPPQPMTQQAATYMPDQRWAESNDDMQRRLSEALQLGDDDVGAPPYAPAPQHAPRRPTSPLSEAQPRGPSHQGVSIQDGPPSHLTPTAPGPGWRPHDQQAQRGSAPFIPAPPVDVRRGRDTRRMPDVSDFPPVGQREYHAKSGGYQQGGHQEPPAPTRRRSLLDRLTGRAKRDAHDPYDDPQFSDDRAHGAPSIHDRAADGDDAELPVFISRERK